MRLPGVWEGLKPGRSLGMRLCGVWEGLNIFGSAATSPPTTRGWEVRSYTD